MSETLTLPTDDGDTFTMDGATYRVRRDYDDMSIMDEQGEGVWCGRLAPSDTYGDGDWSKRPYGFDGGAEKLQFNRGEVVWWEVPADIRGEKHRDVRDGIRRTIVDILDHGYQMIGLERLETCDRGHTHVVNAAWLGMVEPFPDDEYVQEVLLGHVDELKAADAPPTA